MKPTRQVWKVITRRYQTADGQDVALIVDLLMGEEGGPLLPIVRLPGDVVTLLRQSFEAIEKEYPGLTGPGGTITERAMVIPPTKDPNLN